MQNRLTEIVYLHVTSYAMYTIFWVVVLDYKNPEHRSLVINSIVNVIISNTKTTSYFTHLFSFEDITINTQWIQQFKTIFNNSYIAIWCPRFGERSMSPNNTEIKIFNRTNVRLITSVYAALRKKMLSWKWHDLIRCSVSVLRFKLRLQSRHPSCGFHRWNSFRRLKLIMLKWYLKRSRK